MKQGTAGGRIAAIRGEMSQAEFGKLLDSSQGAVSAWERDDKDRSPSAAIYFRLAALATDPDDAVFFLEQGGVPSQAVISVADALLKKGGVKVDTILATAESLLNKQLGDPRQRAKEGKDFIVPPDDESHRLSFDISLAARLVSNQASTSYFVAGMGNLTSRVGHGVAPGEIVVFEAHAPSYSEIIGEKVVFDLEDGLYIGRLGHIADETGNHLVLGPADEYPSNWRGGRQVRVISSFLSRRDLVRDYHRPCDVRRFFGIWIAQFSTGTLELWKKSAHLHAPKK